MTANLRNALTNLEAQWVAVTPVDDGSGLSYRFIDDLIEERGYGQHRELIWTAPNAGPIVQEDPIAFDWSMSCELFLHRNDRTLAAFYRVIADEVVDLVNAFSEITSWGSGVLEAHLDSVDTEVDAPRRVKRAGGISRAVIAIERFNFRFLVQEA